MTSLRGRSAQNCLPSMPLLIAAVLSGCSPAWTQTPLAADLEPSRVFQSDSLTDDDDEPATDLSGIACIPGTETRLCMVINDEGRVAQLVQIEANSLVGGSKVQLIGKEPSASTLGDEPQDGSCSDGKAKFKDLDGEGVAFSAPYFYVVGSHGCSRHGNKLRASAFILARVQVDTQGNPIAVDTTYRLAQVLRTAPHVGPFFTKDLNGADGLNIEGIAVAGDQLVVGLRAPVIDGKAFLISVGLAHLFSDGSSIPPSNARIIPLSLGPNTGIRDLAAISDDGRLLLLAGPAQEQEDVPYGFFLVDLSSPAVPLFLGTLKGIHRDHARPKAEGVAVLGAGRDALHVLVVFDGLRGGSPREYSVPLR